MCGILLLFLSLLVNNVYFSLRNTLRNNCALLLFQNKNKYKLLSCTHPNDDDLAAALSEKDVMLGIFNYIDRIVTQVREIVLCYYLITLFGKHI